MSREFWICLVIAVVCWALAALNGVLYVQYGETVSVLALMWCAGNASWSTYNVLRIRSMDREAKRRGWR
jgi:hypothetical protein